jgi:hypothetical protein
MPGRAKRGIGGKLVKRLDGVPRFDLRQRACRAHTRQHAVSSRCFGRHLGECSLRLGVFTYLTEGHRGFKVGARSRGSLGKPIFVAAPSTNSGDDQHSSRNQINAVPVPQLLELFAPDFLIDFVKDIGQESTPARWPVPGPNCAVT